MTDCPNGEIRDLLPDLLNDRLAPAERAVVEAHVRDCADCQQELALLGGLRRAMHAAPQVAVRDIVAVLPAYRTPARRTWGGWRIAAAVTLLAGGGTSLVIARQAHDAPPLVPVAIAPAGSSPVASAPTRTADRTMPATSTKAPSAASAPKELAVATTSVSDLNDSELTELVNDLESLDAVTPVEVDNTVPVAPLAPASTASPSGTGA